MLKQKFLNFIKSFTVAKLLRWGLKGAVFLWTALLILSVPLNIYGLVQSYDEEYFIWGHDGFANPKKYIWFLVPLEFFYFFFSCYIISDVWHRKSVLYIFLMLMMCVAVTKVVLEVNYHLILLTTFWW